MSPKKDAYSNRTNNSIPAPMEVDSDSDFAPGAYVPTPAKPKRNTKTKASAASSSRNKRKRTSLLDSADDKIQKAKKRSHTIVVNALAQYFGHELDMNSASEDEEDEAHESDGDADEEDENEDEVSQEDSDKDALRRATASLMFVPQKIAGAHNPSPASEDSVTEPESEPEPPKTKVPLKPIVEDSVTESDSEYESTKSTFTKTRSKPTVEDSVTESGSELEPQKIIPPQKFTSKPSVAAEDSVTESDSEPDSQRTKVLLEAKAKPALPDEDSVTESESEPEQELNKQHKLRPRPGFDLKPGQQYASALVLDEETGTKVPAAMNTYLRDYQREGVQFMWKQYKEGLGGLLGDDMGLVRKTIQVISFLSAIMQKDGLSTDENRRADYISKLQDKKAWREKRELPKANSKWPTCLIIAPSTVVHNWERELQTWGYFEVGIYTGSAEHRKQVLKDFKMGRLDVVVTTFGQARRNIELIDDLPWSCVFIDEVHMVKNPTSKVAKAFQQFACRGRFGLTGTTIQNSYREMWTILDWTNPGKLGTMKQWQGYVVKPLTKGQSASASEEERARALLVAKILKYKLLPNFFLRRTKDIIKDQLPQKTDQVVFCPLTKIQIIVYKRLLTMDPVQNILKRDDPCPCGKKKVRKNCCHPFVPGEVFRFMSILIKLSNHLGLILPGPDDTPEQTLRNRELAQFAFPNGDIPKHSPAMLKPEFCGKWEVLEALLRQWRETDKTNKVLIFTKSVKLLMMLDFHLSTKSYKFLRLDGKTKQEERMPMIDEFNHNPHVFIFLISTLAGGTGLNLTGANKVVIFDPNWNPAHDLQAMDRAFRFGQVRDVSVFRLLGAGSVEELIYARQIYKQQQMAIGYDASIQTRYFQGVQGDTTNPGELFGLNNIFKLHEDTLATKEAIEKASLKQLDWAMANMAPEQKKANKQLLEAEAKTKDPDGMDFKGLGALLFDDSPPRLQDDAIAKTLSAVGVKYSHMNEQILLPSRIEAERTKQSLEKVRQRRSVGRASKGASTSQGKGKGKAKEDPTTFKFDVPHRSNAERLARRAAAAVGTSTGQLANAQPMKPPSTMVQPAVKSRLAKVEPEYIVVEDDEPEPELEPETPEEKLMFKRLKQRREALLSLCIFDSPQDVARFAAMFVTLGREEQEKMIRHLDERVAEKMEAREWAKDAQSSASSSSDDE